MSGLTVRTAAKINLLLGVGAPRADGFHTLVTVYQAVSLYDDLTVALPSTGAGRLTVATHVASYIDASHLPRPGHNIVDRAAAALSDHHGRPVTADVRVDKSIPIAGGLAGGSADGAGALLALDRLHGLGISDDDLILLAAGLGSDVPFALVGGSALGEGHGEIVTPLDDRGTWWWVVVPSEEGLSTPAVYRHYDELRPNAPEVPAPPDGVVGALAGGDVHRLAAALHNDLEQAACDLRPDLARLIVEGVAAGALRGLVSGSGPTCVFLCESGDHARTVAGALTAADDRRVVLVAHGPVAGAHVVADG
ncbi:4-(cytidine 5'-diphospho)-2-C-methyl-D-erythritol kinase [Nocardioides sp.]|jgi:4-diphosphocytidyl-2-C-methyl-D-erythritol kinase|uniref:4-(cytidine 5'-diphospho)-2-C-methyl-D-erythritol kinase n=1 Tax=Nocardioides sp. TaxID=35761 RepID=UPI002F3F9A74